MPGPVLIVDDEPNIRKLVRLRLAQSGIEVLEARDGEDAWEQLAAERPALLILDIMMPKLDGIAFLRRVRESEEWRDLPVIMLTAVRDERERQLALSLGAIAVVSKPFIVQDLVQLVEKHA